jgi:hypothetical protein
MIKLSEALRYAAYITALDRRDSICLVLFLIALGVFLVGHWIYSRWQQAALWLGIGVFYATLLALALAVWLGLFST